ncbi:MAG: WecB/TagA/CpsF family glycosyltransferase [Candidatus Komeilibacteria bacterium]
MKKILGVRLDGLSLPHTIDQIQDYLNSNGQYHIATVNPEFLVDAHYNEEFKDILNRCSHNTVDGFGIKLAGLFKGYSFKRCTGIDLVTELCKQEYISKEKIYLLGGREGIGYAASKKLKQINPNINIVGYMSGFVNIKEPSLYEYNNILGNINQLEPTILFVAYNAPYAQAFIDEYLDKMPSVKVAIGLGGTFDFLAGTIQRAPKIFRTLGLEWFYRLIKQPSRIKRIYNAVFKFLYLYFRYDK